MKVEGQIVDIYSQEIYQGSIEVKDGVITSINRHATTHKGYIMASFVDAHGSCREFDVDSRALR